MIDITPGPAFMDAAQKMLHAQVARSGELVARAQAMLDEMDMDDDSIVSAALPALITQETARIARITAGLTTLPADARCPDGRHPDCHCDETHASDCPGLLEDL